MDRKFLSLRKKLIKGNERGVALLLAFSMTLLMLGLIASLYLISVQRHALMRKRVESAKILYLTEAGMNDAIARLRLSTILPPPSQSIIPATGRWYCLDVEAVPPNEITAEFSDAATCAAGTCVPPADVRVCVSGNTGPTGRNQIDATAGF